MACADDAKANAKETAINLVIGLSSLDVVISEYACGQTAATRRR